MATQNSQTVNITLPKALLKRIDAIAKRDYTSRSDVIRQTLLVRVRSMDKAGQEELDEWGDPVGQWKTLADFRDTKHPNGVPASDIVAAIDKLIK